MTCVNPVPRKNIQSEWDSASTELTAVRPAIQYHQLAPAWILRRRIARCWSTESICWGGSAEGIGFIGRFLLAVTAWRLKSAAIVEQIACIFINSPGEPTAIIAHNSGVSQTITAIEPGRRRGRFHIHVDGEYVTSAGEKVVRDLGLFVGSPMTPERLDSIVKAEERRRAMESAMRLLAVRARSGSEIEQRLRRNAYADGIIAEVISSLKSLDLVDDDAFARDWIESRSRSRPKGARQLRAELAQKGVEKAAIDEAVARLSPDDEIALARKALAPKTRRSVESLSESDARAEHRRMAAFLQRRGFAWDTIKTVLAEHYGQNDMGEPD
jgi:regulatory protein